MKFFGGAVMEYPHPALGCYVVAALPGFLAQIYVCVDAPRPHTVHNSVQFVSKGWTFRASHATRKVRVFTVSGVAASIFDIDSAGALQVL